MKIRIDTAYKRLYVVENGTGYFYANIRDKRHLLNILIEDFEFSEGFGLYSKSYVEIEDRFNNRR